MAQYSLPATIPAGQSLSSAVACTSRIAQIFMPTDDWTTAPLTFQVSLDGPRISHLRLWCRPSPPIPPMSCRLTPAVQSPGSGFVLERGKRRLRKPQIAPFKSYSMWCDGVAL
jgi:hypothetical protein